MPERPDIKTSLKQFGLECLVYSVLVGGYYLLVLHLLGGWLKGLFAQDRRLYAGVALGLIIGQGFLLEALTRLLLGWIKPRTEEG
jgi:hypothetical protein